MEAHFSSAAARAASFVCRALNRVLGDSAGAETLPAFAGEATEAWHVVQVGRTSGVVEVGAGPCYWGIVDPWITPYISRGICSQLSSRHALHAFQIAEEVSQHSGCQKTGYQLTIKLEAFKLLQALWRLAHCSC